MSVKTHKFRKPKMTILKILMYLDYRQNNKR